MRKCYEKVVNEWDDSSAFNEGREEYKILPSLRLFVALSTGYPLMGCSSAEPISVLPVE